MTAPVQLLAYRFASDAGFEGRLVGALERIEAGGTLRVLDVLFVGSDPATGEIFGVDLHGSGAGGLVAPLIGFRLDVEERRRITRRARAGRSADLITAIGEMLGPGDAIAAVLVGHEWARALEDAVARTAGTEVANTFVDATSLTAMGPELVEAVRSARAP